MPSRAPERCDGCAEVSNDSRCCIACSQPTADTVGSISVEKRGQCGPIATAHVHCVVQQNAHFMSKHLYVYAVHPRCTANGQLASPSTRCDDIGVGMRTTGTRHETQLRNVGLLPAGAPGSRETASIRLCGRRSRCACASASLHARADLLRGVQRQLRAQMRIASRRACTHPRAPSLAVSATCSRISARHTLSASSRLTAVRSYTPRVAFVWAVRCWR